jgi:murein DD-endopeptidase MepM/ murein hydrolase activator NlpD
MDGRRLTFIVVPHGDLETRSYEISYRALVVLLAAVAVVLAVFIVVVSMWWYVAAQAAMVPGLKGELERLEEEQAKVAELARMLTEVETQYERVRQLLGADAAPPGREPLLPPLRGEVGRERAPDAEASMPVSWPLTEFGYVTREMTGDVHPGLDIAVPQDSYIRAAGGGTVTEAGEDSVYGRFIRLEHGGGIESVYGHASQLFVVTGEMVERNQVIALSGSTGTSTAPHLHFEIRQDGRPTNPWTYVRRR